jgi:hypothetical protein
VFRHSSFQPASFKPVSWRFDDVAPPGPTVVPYGRAAPPKKRRKRLLPDDPHNLVIWLHELS